MLKPKPLQVNRENVRLQIGNTENQINIAGQDIRSVKFFKGASGEGATAKVVIMPDRLPVDADDNEAKNALIDLPAWFIIRREIDGARSSGDPNVASGEEVSRTELLFPGWRDSAPNQVGGKIVAINSRREYSGAYVADDIGIGIFTKSGLTAGPDDSALALYCHPSQNVECSEELAVKTDKKLCFDGTGGNDYIKYNSSNSHLEVYIGGSLVNYFDSTGIH